MKTPFLLALCWMAVSAAAPAAEKLNVLFIAADDLRNDLACYGHPMVKTPNLDRLAKRGLVFDHAYCQQAVCNPSRASLLTGRRLDSLRIWDLPTHFRNTAPDAITLPQHFKNNGYFTQNIGKMFHNWIHEVQGDPDSWSVPAVMHFANHGADKPQVEGDLPLSSAVDPKCECRDVPDEAYFDGRVATLAVKALAELKEKQEPFFLAVGFWKPHSPFNAPKKYWDLYKREEIAMPDPAGWPDGAPRIAWHNSREILSDKQRKLSPDAIREMRHGYLANISYMDAQIGRVLDELDHQGLAEKTVIVFWSDHGYHLGEHTLWAKTSNFELDARVPLIITLPGSANAGKHTPALAELMDLYPTLSDLCGLPAPTGTEGVSLEPVLKNTEAKVRSVALSQHPRPAYYKDAPAAMGYSIRSQTHRYTEWRDWKSGKTIATELYDHEEDPAETRNLAMDQDQEAVVKQHAAQLQSVNPLVRPGWKPVLPAAP